MKNILKEIWAWVLLIFERSGPMAEKAVSEKICNFGGQGRDEYGR